MSRLLGALKLDMLFQFRSGFHIIYAIISVIYITIVNALPQTWGELAVPFLIFSDPSVLGFFFIGGLVMLEKGQGILDLVSVTPLSETEFLLSKIISLNAIAVAASLSIGIFTHQTFNVFLMLSSVILSASFFTIVGFLVALSSHSINHYFGRVIPMMLVIILPVFTLIEFPWSKLFYLLPSVAVARLMMMAFFDGNLSDTLICLVIAFLWNLFIFNYAVNKFKIYVISGGA